MSLHWFTWSNPVAIWWFFLVVGSVANVALWLLLHHRFRRRMLNLRRGLLRIELTVLLCAAYVFGCAFRSVLPRADVQRICLFDTWFSSALVGRSVATFAEICFVIQWAIVSRQLADMVRSDIVRNVSLIIVPLILLAEGCSWYAVVTTNYLGNAIENLLWATTFLFIAIALMRLLVEFHGAVRLAIATAIGAIGGYLAFLITIDVPMYLGRWQADLADGKELLGLFVGLYDLNTRWVVTHEFAHWRDEMAWMSLYFSVAVWSSLALCSFDLVKDYLPRFRTRPDFVSSRTRAAASAAAPAE
jgi:hypothetical protein